MRRGMWGAEGGCGGVAGGWWRAEGGCGGSGGLFRSIGSGGDGFGKPWGQGEATQRGGGWTRGGNPGFAVLRGGTDRCSSTSCPMYVFRSIGSGGGG